MDERYECIYWEIGACDGDNEACHDCAKKLTFGSPLYKIIQDSYQREIDEAIAPVTQKWREMFEKGEIC